MEAHTAILAFESPMMLALMATSSTAVWVLLWRRTGARYMPWLVAGWLLLCVYWSLLAISAGPAPAMQRGEIALIVRGIGLLAAGVMEVGKLLMLWQLWRPQQAVSEGAG